MINHGMNFYRISRRGLLNQLMLKIKLTCFMTNVMKV